MVPERSVTVYGAGAVGCFLGGKLAAVPGTSVTLVGRPPLESAVRERGLVVREGERETVTHPCVATSSRDLPPANLVILSVRTFDVPAAIPDVAALMGDSGLAIAFENGVGIDEELAEALGTERVLAGTLTASAGMEQPGIVEQYSRSGGVALATLDGRRVPAWVVELFAATGLPAVEIPDYRSLRWSKLLLNMLTAPQSAILDMDAAEIAANPTLFRIEQLAFREAGRVMDAQDIRTVSLPGYPVPLARAGMRLVPSVAQRVLGPRIAGSRGSRSPTMRADMARGRTEVAYLNGAVVRAAKRLGLQVPVNEVLAELTELLAERPERREVFRRQPGRLIAYLRSRYVRL